MEHLHNWLNVTDGDLIGLFISSAAYFTARRWCHVYEKFTHEIMNLPEVKVGASEIASKVVAQSAGMVGFFSGKVEPVGELIKPTLSQDGATDVNVTGVVSEISTWEMVKTLNHAFALFTDHEEFLLDFTRTAVPFKIVDGGNSLMISNPMDLEDIPLVTVAEKIRLESMGLWRSILAWTSRYFIIGTKFKEQMLLPGTDVSCLGKLVLRKGVPSLEKDVYFPFTMGIETKQDAINNLAEKRILCLIIEFGFGVLSAYFMYRLLSRKHVLKGTENFDKKYAIRTNCAKNSTIDADMGSLTDEVKCRTCRRLANTVLVPCGHLFLCIFCSRNVTRCAICQKEVKQCLPVMYCS